MKKLFIGLLALLLVMAPGITINIDANDKSPKIIVGTKKVRASVNKTLEHWKHRTYFSSSTSDYGNSVSINHNIQMDRGVSTSFSVRRHEREIGETNNTFSFSVTKVW